MKKVCNKILILVPAETARGGISNYYTVLKNEFSPEIEYFVRGSRTWPVRKGFIPELIRAWADYLKYIDRLRKKDVALVQSSTSLSPGTTIRDGLFLKYARRNGIKTIVFFRGWDNSAEKKIEKKYLNLFRYFFFCSDCIIVLNQNARSCLQNWGYRGEIVTETTLVDKDLIDSVSHSFLSSKYGKLLKTKEVRLLFLSRVEKKKGIYELIEAFKSLKKNVSGFEFILNICGDGFELENIRRKVINENITDISIKGFVTGSEKKAAYLEADLFVFPSYEEGMPNAVLEAMGFGLPVITTNVGGIRDFFVDKKNGSLVVGKNYQDVAEKILTLAGKGEKLKEISLRNHEIAVSKFRSDIVAERIESVFQKVIYSK